MNDENLTHQEYQEKYPEEFATIGGATGEILIDRSQGHSGVYAVPKATRFEIYSSTGAKRVVTLEPGATIHLQDNGRTVKIFTQPETTAQEWFDNLHDWGKRTKSETTDWLEDESLSDEERAARFNSLESVEVTAPEQKDTRED